MDKTTLYATGVRYILTGLFLVILVYPEVGFWTWVCLLLMAINIEFQHGVNQGWWGPLASMLKQLDNRIRDL